MTATINHVVTERQGLPAVCIREVLAVKAEERLTALALPRWREGTMTMPVGRLALSTVLAGNLPLPEPHKVQVRGFPAMALSVAKVAGQRVPIFEGTGHILTVKQIKAMANLSRVDRLMRVNRNGEATLLDDDDLVDLLDPCELRLARRSLAS